MTMACVVQSRFAGLKIVEDDFVAAKVKEMKKEAKKLEVAAAKKSEEKKGKSKNKTSKSGGSGVVTSGNNSNGNGSGGGNVTCPTPSNGTTSTSTSNTNWITPTRKKRRNSNNTQWEEWKQKDNEMVDGHYEEDLHKAILMSKLEYEEQKKNIKIVPKTKESEPGDESKGSKKHKKNKTLTLGQFEKEVIVPVEEIYVKLPDESTFFAKVNKEAKEELAKNKLTEKVKKREPPTNDEIKGSKLRNILELRDKEIKQLKSDVEKLQAELLKVKTRNKQLCNIIGQGEMKDKAQVLMETENLREVQAELNAEVAALNVTLQQERSRCSCNSTRPDKKKRPPASDRET